MEPINQQWIKKYVEELIAFAKDVGPDSVIGASILLRADAILDLVKAWRELNHLPQGTPNHDQTTKI